MADGAVVIGSYDPYALTVHGDIVLGIYDPYPLTVHGVVVIGTYNIGFLPVYNPSIIIAVTRVQQNLAFPQYVIGGQGTNSQYALFKKSESYGFYLWRSPVYLIGTDFDVLRIIFPLIADIAAGTSIVPKLYFDDQSLTVVGNEINLANYPSGNKLITLTAKNFDNEVHGKSNFFLELQLRGTALSPISLPIHIDIDVQ